MAREKVPPTPSQPADGARTIVLVVAPEVFEDRELRQCVLLRAEPSGLWLEIVDPAVVGIENVERGPSRPVAAFVPFAQILYVIDPKRQATVGIAVRMRERRQQYMEKVAEFRRKESRGHEKERRPPESGGDSRARHKPPRKR